MTKSIHHIGNIQTSIQNIIITRVHRSISTESTSCIWSRCTVLNTRMVIAREELPSAPVLGSNIGRDRKPWSSYEVNIWSLFHLCLCVNFWKYVFTYFHLECAIIDKFALKYLYQSAVNLCNVRTKFLVLCEVTYILSRRNPV